MPKIIQLKSKSNQILGAPDLIIEVQSITPNIAALWLKANTHNRPIKKRHVEFLGREMTLGNWQLNGQAIIISDNEDVLDGQHRLLAVIDSGETIDSLVIYGIKRDAFKTIDTGRVRGPADALSLWYPDVAKGIDNAVGSAVGYCHRIEAGFYGDRKKIGNTDVLTYVAKHKSLWRCAELLMGFPRDARPLSLSATTACYEIFQRKDEDKSDAFMRRFYTGEGLHSKDAEYILRNLLIRDAQRLTTYPIELKLKMMVKAWNLVRRGRGDDAARQAITIGPNEADRLMVL